MSHWGESWVRLEMRAPQQALDVLDTYALDLPVSPSGKPSRTMTLLYALTCLPVETPEQAAVQAALRDHLEVSGHGLPTP